MGQWMTRVGRLTDSLLLPDLDRNISPSFSQELADAGLPKYIRGMRFKAPAGETR
jgi:hypothetical protein